MTDVLAILGAGGHGRVVADSAEAAGWQKIVFFDDRFPNLVDNHGWPVIGSLVDLLADVRCFAGVIVGIGDGRARLDILGRLDAAGAIIASVIHPRAWVSTRASLGAGVVVSAGAVINIGADIGRGCIINTGATVDHDCKIAAGVHIAPGAHVSGGVEIGTASWVGVGACVRQGIHIGTSVIVGAGAAVVTDLPDNVVATGVPARSRN